MIKVADIVKKARLELGNTILTYLCKLDAFYRTKDVRLMTAPENDITIDRADMLNGSALYIHDDKGKLLCVRQLCLIFGELHVKTDDYGDYMDYELSFDDLGRIATTLENEWEYKTKEVAR